MNSKVVITISVVAIILAGAGAGLLLSRKSNPSVEGIASGDNMIKTSTQAGVKDCKGDHATGNLDKTSGKEQGTHKLLREGGPSQTLYMVSSVVDLDEYVGKKLEVCGDSQKLQGVSWFMDVAQVKIVQ